MARFKKKIVTPGVYRTGQDKLTPVSAETISKIAKSAMDMIAAGIKIPAPFAHKDENGVVPAPLLMDGEDELDAKTKSKSTWNSVINAGFWEKFEVDPEDNGLVGYLDVPGEGH